MKMAAKAADGERRRNQRKSKAAKYGNGEENIESGMKSWRN
jgi:hypothetical protein